MPWFSIVPPPCRTAPIAWPSISPSALLTADERYPRSAFPADQTAVDDDRVGGERRRRQIVAIFILAEEIGCGDPVCRTADRPAVGDRRPRLRDDDATGWPAVQPRRRKAVAADRPGIVDDDRAIIRVDTDVVTDDFLVLADIDLDRPGLVHMHAESGGLFLRMGGSAQLQDRNSGDRAGRQQTRFGNGRHDVKTPSVSKPSGRVSERRLAPRMTLSAMSVTIPCPWEQPATRGRIE